MTKNYEIGQVVFIVPEQAQTILPGIVVEEITVRKINGNSTSWKLKVGSPEKAKIIDSEKVNGEVYGSLEEVRVVISNKLSDYLNKVTADAEGLVEKWYGKDIAEKQKNLPRISPSSLDSDLNDPDLLLSSLESGSSFVPENHNVPAPMKKIDSIDSAKNRLREMATDLTEIPVDTTMPKVYMTQPDGTRVEVGMSKI